MDGLGFFKRKIHLEKSRVWFLPLNPFESSSPKMLDHLEARIGKKSHQITSSCSTLASSLTLFSQIRFVHKGEVSKTKCGLIPLIHYKAMFGTSINPFLIFGIFITYWFSFHFHLSFNSLDI